MPTSNPAHLTFTGNNTLMTREVNTFDWASTPLGPVAGWPDSLCSLVRLVLNSAQPMYLTWGPARISIFNDGYLPILGDKHSGALGQPYADLWSEVMDEIQPMIRQVQAGRSFHLRSQPFALTGREDKSLSWFDFSWSPVFDEDNRIQGFLVVATETTEDVLHQAQLKRVLRLMNEVERNGEMGTWELNLDRREITCSIGMCRLFELDSACAVWPMRTLFERMHPDEHVLNNMSLEDLVHHGSDALQEYRIITPSGVVRWISTFILSQTEADRGESLVQGVTVDITARKESGHQTHHLLHSLRHSNHLLATIRTQQTRLDLALDAARMGLWEWSAETNDFTVDRRAAAILSADPKTFKLDTQAWQGNLHPDERSVTSTLFADFLQGNEEQYVAEFRYRDMKGAWLWLLVSAKATLRDSDGHARHVLGTVQDVSSSRKSLHQSNLLLEQIRSLIEGMHQKRSPQPSPDPALARLDQLTRRQQQLLTYIANGWTSKRIADELHLSLATVVTHRRDLMRKLELHNTAEVTAFALRCGLIADT